MTEEVFTKNIKRIENLYSVLISGETNPQKEVEIRIELIDALSNIEASLYSEKEANKDFISILVKLRENLLNWDPYGQWFRHQKDLVDMVYEVIVKAKNVIFTRGEGSSGEASRLKTELSALKNELNELRSLMSSLLQQTQASQDTPRTTTELTPQEPSSPATKGPGLSTKQLIDAKEKTSSRDVAPIQSPLEQRAPPVILPLEAEKPPSIQETLPEAKNQKKPLQEEEAPKEQEGFISTQLLDKFNNQKTPEEQPSTILKEMKSILSEAEKATEKQLANLREQLDSSPETRVVPPVVIDDVEGSDVPLQEKKVVVEKPGDATKATGQPTARASAIEEHQPTPTTSSDLFDSEADPYMQLLTLEAEKYRLEKEYEKNEIDFQEGSKNKQEFDDTIARINRELTVVREQISALRKKLAN